MIVFISGIRQEADSKTLSQLIEYSPWDITTVVTSDRGGVDAWARQWAIDPKIELIVVETQWKVHGSNAIRERNTAAFKTAEACMFFIHPSCPYSVSIAQQTSDWHIPVCLQHLEPL